MNVNFRFFLKSDATPEELNRKFNVYIMSDLGEKFFHASNSQHLPPELAEHVQKITVYTSFTAYDQRKLIIGVYEQDGVYAFLDREMEVVNDKAGACHGVIATYDLKVMKVSDLSSFWQFYNSLRAGTLTPTTSWEQPNPPEPKSVDQ